MLLTSIPSMHDRAPASAARRSGEGFVQPDLARDLAVTQLLVEVEDGRVLGVVVGLDGVHPVLDGLDQRLQLERPAQARPAGRSSTTATQTRSGRTAGGAMNSRQTSYGIGTRGTLRGMSSDVSSSSWC